MSSIPTVIRFRRYSAGLRVVGKPFRGPNSRSSSVRYAIRASFPPKIESKLFLGCPNLYDGGCPSLRLYKAFTVIVSTISTSGSI